MSTIVTTFSPFPLSTSNSSVPLLKLIISFYCYICLHTPFVDMFMCLGLITWDWIVYQGYFFVHMCVHVHACVCLCMCACVCLYVCEVCVRALSFFCVCTVLEQCPAHS